MPLSFFPCGRRAAWVLSMSLIGCSPTLDWRQVGPEGSDATAIFPCKPTTDARVVNLAGVRVRMVLVACRAGGATWALAFADVADPALVTRALQDLRRTNADNLEGTPSVIGPMRISGMTPNPHAEHVRMLGRLPGGDPVTLEIGFFARGTRVYQATVMGKALDAETVSGFFEGLKFPALP